MFKWIRQDVRSHRIIGHCFGICINCIRPTRFTRHGGTWALLFSKPTLLFRCRTARHLGMPEKDILDLRGDFKVKVACDDTCDGARVIHSGNFHTIRCGRCGSRGAGRRGRLWALGHPGVVVADPPLATRRVYRQTSSSSAPGLSS